MRSGIHTEESYCSSTALFFIRAAFLDGVIMNLIMSSAGKRQHSNLSLQCNCVSGNPGNLGPIFSPGDNDLSGLKLAASGQELFQTLRVGPFLARAAVVLAV